MQAVPVVHDTPFNVLCGAAGVLWSDQLAPFQNSVRLVAPALPTAMHPVAEEHETAESMAPGAGWIVQVVPFQSSANDDWELLCPTAMQAFAEVHDTPYSALAALRFGLLWIVQTTPFQNSANVTSAPRRTENPTAVQAFAEAHETAVSWLWSNPTGFGVG